MEEPFQENPYQSPEATDGAGGGFLRPAGLVRHVRVVAILMLVQGGLESLMSVMFGVFAVALPQMMKGLPTHADSPPPDQFFWFMTAMYSGQAAATLAAAALHIAAGVQNYRFRGRILGFFALAGGLLTALSCYCIPTAVGLGVYGLIVYLNDAVSEAFRMGRSGRTASQILADFQP